MKRNLLLPLFGLTLFVFACGQQSEGELDAYTDPSTGLWIQNQTAQAYCYNNECLIKSPYHTWNLPSCQLQDRYRNSFPVQTTESQVYSSYNPVAHIPTGGVINPGYYTAPFYAANTGHVTPGLVGHMRGNEVKRITFRNPLDIQKMYFLSCGPSPEWQARHRTRAHAQFIFRIAINTQNGIYYGGHNFHHTNTTNVITNPVAPYTLYPNNVFPQVHPHVVAPKGKGSIIVN